MRNRFNSPTVCGATFSAHALHQATTYLSSALSELAEAHAQASSPGCLLHEGEEADLLEATRRIVEERIDTIRRLRDRRAGQAGIDTFRGR